MSTELSRLLSVLLLAALLFVPVSRIIWALSCRRLARKLSRELGNQELQGQLHRARVLAVVVVVVFSYLFHLNVLDRLHG